MSTKNYSRNLKVSVVVAVLNEQESISLLLSALMKQTHQPDEVIVVDGGSTDKTIEIVEKFQKVKIISEKSNRSQARNLGISLAENSLIAITDAGCIPQKNWIKFMCDSLIDNDAQVVAGFYTAKATSLFEKCIAPYVLVMPDKIDDSRPFLPATRSMLITKEAWKENGRFPEEYTHNEDYVFSRRLVKNNIKICFSKRALVEWIPRKNLVESTVMFFRFSYGDSEAGIFRPKVLLIFLRYIFACVITVKTANAITPLLFGTGYILWAVVKNYNYVRDPRALVILPIIQISSDISIMAGTLAAKIKNLL